MDTDFLGGDKYVFLQFIKKCIPPGLWRYNLRMTLCIHIFIIKHCKLDLTHNCPTLCQVSARPPVSSRRNWQITLCRPLFLSYGSVLEEHTIL